MNLWSIDGDETQTVAVLLQMAQLCEQLEAEKESRRKLEEELFRAALQFEVKS